MSMRSLESAILAEAREFFNYRSLRLKDIREWSTGEIKAEPDEVLAKLPHLGVNICIYKIHDKRKRLEEK